MSTKPKIFSPPSRSTFWDIFYKCKMTVPYCLLCLACLQGVQELPVMSAWVSHEAAAPYGAWHHHDTVGSGSFLWNLTSPMTGFSEVRTRVALICHGISRFTRLALTFWPVLSSESKIHQRTMNSWWAWGLSQKIIHSPFSCKAGFGCVFISSACFGHHHTQGKKLIICEWMSHFWWAGLIFNPTVWGSGSGWHGQNYSVQQIFIPIKQLTVIKRLHPKMCCWKTAMP